MNNEGKRVERQESAGLPQKKEKMTLKRFWKEWREVILILAAVFVVFKFILQIAWVPSGSMETTLPTKSVLVGLQLPYIVADPVPQRGDIVTFWSDELGKVLVKRVIAVGGQTVDIDFNAGVVYVDGQALDEPYTFEPTYLSYAEYGKALDYPVTVPEGELFVMGDNRNHSEDSRFSDVGCVKKEAVLGKVLFVVFPGRQTNEYGTVTGGRSWHRFGAVS